MTKDIVHIFLQKSQLPVSLFLRIAGMLHALWSLPMSRTFTMVPLEKIDRLSGRVTIHINFNLYITTTGCPVCMWCLPFDHRVCNVRWAVRGKTQTSEKGNRTAVRIQDDGKWADYSFLRSYFIWWSPQYFGKDYIVFESVDIALKRFEYIYRPVCSSLKRCRIFYPILNLIGVTFYVAPISYTAYILSPFN